MTERLPEPLSPGMVTARPELAARTAADLSLGEPTVVWERRVGPGAFPFVRIDGLLTVGGYVYEVATGRQLPARASAFPLLPPWYAISDSFAANGDGAEIWSLLPTYSYHVARLWDGLVLDGRQAGYKATETLWVNAADPLTGEYPWHRRVDGAGRDMWKDWFHLRHGTLRVHAEHHGKRLAMLDPATGRARWKVRWHPARPADMVGPPRRARAIEGDSVLVVVVDDDGHGADAVAGIDDRDGTTLWRAGVAPGTSVIRCGAAGPMLVSCAFHNATPAAPVSPEERARQARLAVAQLRAPADGYLWSREGTDDPDDCTTCGGPAAPMVAVDVRDKITGELAWSHSFPWPDRHRVARDGTLVVHDGIVITREQDFLRGRGLADGRVRWSASVPRLRPLAPGPLAGRWETSESFPDASKVSDSMACDGAWAWLHQQEPGAGGLPPQTVSTFIHAATGRALTVPRAFHHTAADLVLTYAGDTLTCLALPASPPPRPELPPPV